MELTPGEVWWAVPDPAVGREQSGRRPVLIVSGYSYLELVTALAMTVPITSVDHRWPNHVELTGPHGLDRSSFAMTEQVRTVSRERLTKPAGCVDPGCLAEVHRWLVDYLTD